MSAVAHNAGRARLVADGLFFLQAGCALLFGISQFRRMLESVEGVSVTWMAFWVAFLLVNLGLAIGAHRKFASRISRQVITIYSLWTGVCAANLVLLLVSPGVEWTLVDSVTATLTLGGVVIATAIGRARGLRLGDPMLHAAYAVFCKAVPQLTLAWNIFREGGEGISVVAFTAGHVTICMRLAQIIASIREAGLDRARLGMAIGEAANEASWVLATVVWLWVG
ncbi:MAG: hypothetical protein IPM80_01070 [Proteobacteria bacterium]|nr:hypothetical protein [Pseudomonadota bacterium]